MDFRDGGWCTAFPEYWYTWTFKKVKISDLCKKHDNAPSEGEEFKGCSNTTFYKDTWRARLIGAVTIASIASIACWVKYFKQQKERV